MKQKTEKNILVIKLGALGDFIQALGPMAAIRAHHPKSRITLLTTNPYETLARESGYVDDIWIDSRPRWHDVGGWLSLRKKLNDGKFFRVYDLQNNDRTSFYLKLFSPRPEWIGAAKGASHRNTSPERTAGQAYDGHVQTLLLAGIENVALDRLEWMKGRDAFEGLVKPYMLIVPGSAANHPEKRWPVSHYVECCKKLTGQGYQSVFLGGKSETDILSTLAENIPQSLNLAERTSLFDIAALARNAAGAIGNDTGPMHIIAPTGCPSIVLFSKESNPQRHAPKGDHVLTLQKDNLSDLSPEDVAQAFMRQQGSS